ncbi:hypothetical protein C8J56DRAFT_1057640 [Mycena floridula]|nr:hypothetical protein C8J56DRAFT_1057640 [Mycena floridula]
MPKQAGSCGQQHRKAEEKREEAIQLGVLKLLAGESYRDAEQHFGIPRSTLEGRMKGVVSRRKSHGSQQALYPAEEAALLELLREMAQWGLHLRVTHIKTRALCILRERQSSPSLGKKWINKFLVI